MDNVVKFTGLTKLDLDPDTVLAEAIGKMSEVVICGYDKDGNAYCASSVSDGGSILWHLEVSKRMLFQCIEDM